MKIFLTPILGYNKKKIDTATNFTYLEGVTRVEKELTELKALYKPCSIFLELISFA